MKFKIKALIDLHPEIDVTTLIQVISPENKTMKNGEVVSYIEKQRIITKINGTMSVGTLLNTIDDILKTAILSKEVSSTTNSYN